MIFLHLAEHSERMKVLVAFDFLILMRGSYERGLRKLVRCSRTFGDKPIHTAGGGQALPLLLSAARCHHLPVGHQTAGAFKKYCRICISST